MLLKPLDYLLGEDSGCLPWTWSIYHSAWHAALLFGNEASFLSPFPSLSHLDIRSFNTIFTDHQSQEIAVS